MRSVILLCVLGAVLFATDFAYWRLWDHQAASGERSAAFSETCAGMAADFDAQSLGNVRPRAYEQNLGMLKTHHLMLASQCMQLRGRCEVGYRPAKATSPSWRYDARFVARPMHHCIFPVTLLQGGGRQHQVELME